MRFESTLNERAVEAQRFDGPKSHNNERDSALHGRLTGGRHMRRLLRRRAARRSRQLERHGVVLAAPSRHVELTRPVPQRTHDHHLNEHVHARAQNTAQDCEHENDAARGEHDGPDGGTGMRRLDVQVAASHREADEQSDKHEKRI